VLIPGGYAPRSSIAIAIDGNVVLVFSAPQLAYLILAQEDSPPHKYKPFLVGSIYRCLQIDYVLWRWYREMIGVGQRVAYDWIVRKVKKRQYEVR
jgi:hypothetical protein